MKIFYALYLKLNISVEQGMSATIQNLDES